MLVVALGLTAVNVHGQDRLKKLAKGAGAFVLTNALSSNS